MHKKVLLKSINVVIAKSMTYIYMFAICISTGNGLRLHSTQNKTWNAGLPVITIKTRSIILIEMLF